MQNKSIFLCCCHIFLYKLPPVGWCHTLFDTAVNILPTQLNVNVPTKQRPALIFIIKLVEQK